MNFLILVLAFYFLPMIVCQVLICLELIMDKSPETRGKKDNFKFQMFWSAIPLLNCLILIILPFLLAYTFSVNFKPIDKLYEKIVNKRNRKS